MSNNVNMVFGTGLSSSKTRNELYELLKHAIDCGIRSIDTAPSYKTEETIGEVIKGFVSNGFVRRDELFIQDKVDAWQMQDCNGLIDKFVFDSLKKMSLSYLDCVFLHWPLPDFRDNSLKRLLGLKKDGIIKYVGICNVRIRQLTELEESGILPDIIQIERNPLRICSDEASFCRKRGIKMQSYSPLCKYCDEIKNSDVLIHLSQKLNKSIGQIIMRWHIDTGFIPVFTTKKTYRIDEYTSINSFSLNAEEIEAISALNKNYKIYLESISCPGF